MGVNPTVKAQDEAVAKRQAMWARRRPAWTRTDTVRWLNDRSAAVLALLRRADAAAAPVYSSSMGRWLKDNSAALFQRAHERLAQPGRNERARQALNVIEVLT